jgi:hypothetical protein
MFPFAATTTASLDETYDFLDILAVPALPVATQPAAATATLPTAPIAPNTTAAPSAPIAPNTTAAPSTPTAAAAPRMQTRSHSGIHRSPRERLNLHTSVTALSLIPKSVCSTLNDPNWYAAMVEEFQALTSNNT